MKARVDTNNHRRFGQYGQYGTVQASPLTYVLMKGRVKSTFNYIVDNLHTYAEPLLQHVSKQSEVRYKHGHKETKIKKSLQSPHQFHAREVTLPVGFQAKIPLNLLRESAPVKTASRKGKRAAKSSAESKVGSPDGQLKAKKGKRGEQQRYKELV